ncbi:MAG: ORF6N domain-containing protein [Bacteroidales bacterium]|nr:ORF6N domain-containing protein [Bacteroidales bacterium]
MFRLTNDERDFVRLRSQIVTINNGRGQHSKYLPYAFTELGVATAILVTIIAFKASVEFTITYQDVSTAYTAYKTAIIACPCIGTF